MKKELHKIELENGELGMIINALRVHSYSVYDQEVKKDLKDLASRLEEKYKAYEAKEMKGKEE